MLLREITIGRSKNSDIYLDSRCQYASNHHATMYYDGEQLMYKDISTNGTLINNIRVKHRAVPVRRGDTIMIAGMYPLNWNQIDAYFPPFRPLSTQVSAPPQPAPSAAQAPALSEWSWGAFVLYPIWGFFNGCWWMFLVWFGVLLLSLIPFLNILSGIGALVLAIVFGINGRKWAWENRIWNSVEDFESTQGTWDKVGLVLFILSLVVVPLTLIIFFSAIVASL